jgi:predicted nucleic acid-binding protein
MSSLTIDELRQHKQELEQHISAKLNDFTKLSGLTIEEVNITPIARYGFADPCYYVQLDVSI